MTSNTFLIRQSLLEGLENSSKLSPNRLADFKALESSSKKGWKCYDRLFDTSRSFLSTYIPSSIPALYLALRSTSLKLPARLSLVHAPDAPLPRLELFSLVAVHYHVLSLTSKPSNQVAATAITQKSTSTTSTPSGAILSPSRPILASPCAWTFATGLVASPSFKLVRLQAKLALFAGPYKRVPKEEEERVEGAWEWEENLFIAEEEEDFGDLSDSDSFSSDDSLRSSPPSLLFDSPPQSLFPDLSSPPVPTEKLPAPSHADEQSVDEDFDDNVEEENSYSTSDGSVTEEIYDSNLDRFTYTELYPGEQDDEEYFAELPTFADSPSPSPRPPADFTVLKAEKLEFSCVDELQLESSCSPIFAPSPIRVNLPPPSPRLTPASLSIPQHITNLSNIDDDSFLPTFIHLPSIRKITTLPPRPRRKFSAPSPSLHREVVLYASLKAAVWLNDWQKANSFEELREWSALSLSDATSWTELGEGRGRASERKGRG